MLLNETAFDAAYGITPYVAAELRFSLRITDISPTYSELGGTAKQVPNDIHHRNETLAGPTDPWISLRIGAQHDKITTTARFGVTLPIGRTEPNPYKLGARGESHQHIQFGTGTVVPIVGAGISYNLDPLNLSASALGLFNVYANKEGYRAPSRYFLSLRGTLSLLDDNLRPYGTLDLAHETEEIWDGAMGLEGSNIRTDLLVGAGLGYRFYDPWMIELGGRARIARLNGTAPFVYPGVLELRLSGSFDLNGEPQ